MNIETITQESLNGATVCKHNDLIEAKYQLPNLQEQRLILMLLSQIKKDDEDFKCYRIGVKDFAEMLEVKGNDIYDKLDKATTSLMSRVIIIRNDKSFLKVNWLSSAEYRHGSGYVELAFDPKLKPYLLQLKSHFTQYKLDIPIHFKSIYSIRLYELLKKESYKAKNGQFSVFFEYTNLREKFGVGKKEYALFKDFRVKTIEPAIREISDKTDLIIADVKYGKTGRAITNITFVIGIRTENETKLRQANLRIEDIKPEKPENHPIVDTLVSLGFSLDVAKIYKNKYSIKHIERNIAYTLGKVKVEDIKNIPAYLNKAIENDYAEALDIQKTKEKERRQAIADNEQKELENTERKKLETREKSKKTLDAFYSLPQERQEAIKRDFVVKMQTTKAVVFKAWLSSKNAGENPIERPTVRGDFISFLNENSFFVV